MTGRPVYVCSTKFDGSPHWQFDSWLLLEQGPLVVTLNFAGQELQTWRGPWKNPFHTRNHFWVDRWYNVMRLERSRGGGLDGWYCNVATPVQYDGQSVRYVDLDLDVRVAADGTARVVDEDEFLENSERMCYPPAVIDQARAAVAELLALAEARSFPFEAS